MNPVIALLRRLTVLLLAGLALAAGPAVAQTTTAAAAEDDLFRGRIIRVEQVLQQDNRPPIDVYTVRVQWVYQGEADAQVTVRTRGAAAECGGDVLRETANVVFRVVSDNPSLFTVTGCGQVEEATEARIRQLERAHPDGGAPGSDDQEPTDPAAEEPVVFRDVGADEPQSFNRAAAPGLALVIVGLLGFLVVRRLGRR